MTPEIQASEITSLSDFQRLLSYFCQKEKITFSLNGKDIDSKEVFSFDKLLPAIAFHSFNVLRTPWGNNVLSNQALDTVDSMMPIYTDNKDNKTLDCSVFLENKAIGLMMVTHYLEEYRKAFLTDENDHEQTVDIEIEPLVVLFKDAMDKHYIKKITPAEANKRGIKTGIIN